MDDILDMSLTRFRRTIATISERKIRQAYQANQNSTVQIRTICSFIAATVPVEKGEKNELLKLAQSIGEADDAKPKTKSSNEPEAGSYERFMSLFSG